MVDKESTVIFLFSSGQRQLYRQDIYNVLAYPENFIMHFRYRKSWVDATIWDNESEDLVGMNALIIAIAQKSDNSPEFFPIRYAKITNIEKEGDSLHIYFKLLNSWVDYSYTDYDSIIKKIPNVPYKDVDNFLKGKFITSGNICGINVSSTDIAWNSIIEKIGYKKPFVRV